MKRRLPADADVDNTATWARYTPRLCNSCRAVCCTLAVEVRAADLVNMGIISEFEQQEAGRKLADRLKKAGIISHYHHKKGLYTISRKVNGDCRYLDSTTRRCTIYSQRPATCRNHPDIGPRPGYCPYQQQR